MFYALLAGGVLTIWEWVRTRMTRWQALQGGTAVLLICGLMAGLFVQSSLNGEKALFLDRFDARLAGRARTTIGRWLRE
jgi:hypothetical protein